MSTAYVYLKESDEVTLLGELPMGTSCSFAEKFDIPSSSSLSSTFDIKLTTIVRTSSDYGEDQLNDADVPAEEREETLAGFAAAIDETFGTEGKQIPSVTLTIKKAIRVAKADEFSCISTLGKGMLLPNKAPVTLPLFVEGTELPKQVAFSPLTGAKSQIIITSVPLEGAKKAATAKLTPKAGSARPPAPTSAKEGPEASKRPVVTQSQSLGLDITLDDDEEPEAEDLDASIAISDDGLPTKCPAATVVTTGYKVSPKFYPSIFMPEWPSAEQEEEYATRLNCARTVNGRKCFCPTALIAPKVSNTPKLLYCLALGVPILKPEALGHMTSTGRYRELSEEQLDDLTTSVPSLKCRSTFKGNVINALIDARDSSRAMPFAGKKVAVLSTEVTPSAEAYKRALQYGGASVTDVADGADVVVAVDEKAAEGVADARKGEFILMALLQDTLDVKKLPLLTWA